MLSTFAVAVVCAAPQVPPSEGDPGASAPPPEIRIVAAGETRRVSVGDALFAVYGSAPDTPTPVLFPLLGPGQTEVTRRWPLTEPAPGEAKDHPHHRSVWFAHGSVNGHDFWHGTHSKDVIVHAGWLPVAAVDRGRALRSRNRWVADDGSTVCTDERYLRFGVDPAGDRWLDYRVTIFASEGEVVFGDTKEGVMACRLAPGLRLRGAVAAGHILDSHGRVDGDCWGKRSAWVAYSGPARVAAAPDDAPPATVTVAMFEHPSNPRHETWWHARDYGLLAANPFGRRDFEGKDAESGEFRLAADRTVTFSYRLWFLRGAAAGGDLAARYAEFARFQFPIPSSEDDDR